MGYYIFFRICPDVQNKLAEMWEYINDAEAFDYPTGEQDRLEHIDNLECWKMILACEKYKDYSPRKWTQVIMSMRISDYPELSWLQWCAEQCTGSWATSWTNKLDGVRFHFENPQDAIMMKLRLCGK